MGRAIGGGAIGHPACESGAVTSERSVPSSGVLSDLLIESGLRIATAESLTGGMLAGSFAEMPDASRFFLGGIVAYASEVKFNLLGVTPGPVVNDRAAGEMAIGAQRLFQADIVIAVTGVGGPDPAEGHRPGTVYVAVMGPGDSLLNKSLALGGSPEVDAVSCATTASSFFDHCS